VPALISSGVAPAPLHALLRALPMLGNARILAVVFVPLVGAALLWGAVGWLAWPLLLQWLGLTGGWSLFAAGVATAAVLMVAALVTALVAVAVLAMPVIVATVAERDFPTLDRRRGATFAGSLGNAMFAVLLFVPLWLIALLLLALPPIYVVAQLCLNAWLNQRLFRYDALATHADREEMRGVIRAARGRLFVLGLMLSPLSLIPVVNLFAPIYAGIAFTYLCLGELAAARAEAASSFTTHQD
jgi:CysZ protein